MAFFIVALLGICRPGTQADGESSPSALVQELGSDNARVRDEALRKLRGIGKPAIPALQSAAAGDNKEIVARAQFLLKVFELRDTLSPRILKAFPDAADRLATGGDAAWTALLSQAAGSTDDGAPAFPALTNEDFDLLIAHALRGATTLQDRQKLCRFAVERSLRSIVPELVRLCGSAEFLDRSSAADALVDLHAVDAAGLLADLAASDAPADRRAGALWTIGRLKAVKTIPALVARSSDSEPLVRQAAASSLIQIDTPESVAAGLKFLADPVPAVRTDIVNALWNGGKSDRVPVLKELLEKDPDAGVRGTVVSALSQLAGREALPEIRKALRDPEASVRMLAVVAGVQLDDRDGVDALPALLKDGNEGVRGWAARAAGLLGATSVAPRLIELLKDERPWVRGAAAEGLCRFGRREGVRTLLELADADATLPLTALNALRRQEDWTRLAGVKATSTLESTREVLAGKLIPAAAVVVESGPGASLDGSSFWLLGTASDLRRKGWLTALEAIEAARPQGRVEIVLEPGKIRLLGRREALAFWKDWVAAEKPK